MNTRREKLDPWNPDPKILSEAGAVLRSGGLVAFPTETVYGLGANALAPEAVKKIFQAKGRPSDNPLILHLSRAEQAEPLAYLDGRARRLMAAFWPGPLTLVLRARDAVPRETRGGLDTAALRMPDHPIASALIEAAGVPVAAPSANLSGRPSPTDAGSVWEDMQGRVDIILDGDDGGGSAAVGIESTVIDVSEDMPLLLRPGGLSREVIEDFLKAPLGVPDEGSQRRSPGTRYRHYAPRIPVQVWRPGEPLTLEGDAHEWAFMGTSVLPARFGRVLRFDSIENYARGLFAGFRALEAGPCRGIVVEWPPSVGVGLGLGDRIRRAAASPLKEGG